ncbi:hypothetical protein [Arthrobacter sp. S41]|uniref:hypothetical protein n=1 Tax=Arthrobacter sp. S41 TaxID=2509721 RepID=UPI001035C5AA|nr:hypothetical protein [Arthrobacter sp. S41]TAP26860.1 hypothetical protein EYR88_00375 [Arthrobacter sp. S41]
MAKTKVKLHIAAFNDLRNRSEVVDLVGSEAAKVAELAGPGFGLGVHQMGSRVIANVYTATADAMRLEAKEGVLSKALGGSAVPAKVRYTTKAGKTRWASQAQVSNWTKGSL